MNKAEMNNVIVSYAEANEQKKHFTDIVADLGADIKEYFEDRGISTFEAMGYVATVSVRKGKKLNLDKIAKLLGGKIPDDCYIDTETDVLTVKPSKTAKGSGDAPKTAVVAA